MCLIPLLLNSAYAANPLENATLEGKNSIISLDIKFGEDTVKHLPTRSIIINNLDEVTLTFGADELFLSDLELNLTSNYNHFRISSVSDGIIMYGHKNINDESYNVNVYIATDNGLQKFSLSVSTPPPKIEKKIITSIEIPEEEKQYIPDLKMTSSHDFRTYWKEMFDVDVQSFDGNINPKPTKYPFEGRLGGADVSVIISLDDEHFATLSGVTSDRRQPASVAVLAGDDEPLYNSLSRPSVDKRAFAFFEFPCSPCAYPELAELTAQQPVYDRGLVDFALLLRETSLAN